MTHQVKIHVSEKSGDISCEIIEPPAARAVLVLAHGAGAGMHHPFMLALAEALSENGITTMRYQFPYMENGKKRPDSPAIAQETIKVVIDDAIRLYPHTPIYAGGKSFGGRMTSLFAASQQPEIVKGLVFYGFPLHPAGKPSVTRAHHLKDISCPTLFLQGTRDKLATPELLKEVITPIEQATLIELDGADHSFHMLKKSSVSDHDLIMDLAAFTRKWMAF